MATEALPPPPPSPPPPPPSHDETAFDLLLRKQGRWPFGRLGIDVVDDYRRSQWLSSGAGNTGNTGSTGPGPGPTATGAGIGPAAAAESHPKGARVSAPRDVVELAGLSSSGKTEVAMLATVTCVLPALLGGEGGSALYFDSDMRLNAERLVGLLLARIEKAMGDGVLAQDEAKRVAHACLERVFVFRCTGNAQLLSTLHALTEPYLRQHNVRLLVVDSVASFYWEDLATDPISTGLHVSIPMAIHRVVELRALTVLATKPVLFRAKPGNPAPEFLSATWQRLVTSRLLVECLDAHAAFRLSDVIAGQPGSRNNSVRVVPLLDFTIANDTGVTPAIQYR